MAGISGRTAKRIKTTSPIIAPAPKRAVMLWISRDSFFWNISKVAVRPDIIDISAVDSRSTVESGRSIETSVIAILIRKLIVAVRARRTADRGISCGFVLKTEIPQNTFNSTSILCRLNFIRLGPIVTCSGEGTFSNWTASTNQPLAICH